MTIAHEDIREVCGQIVGICRRLGASWAAVAADMNEDAAKRLEAAVQAPKLQAAASAIEAIVDGSCSMAVRMVHAEDKLAEIAKHVEAHAASDLGSLGETISKSLHLDFVEKIKGVLSK